MMEERSPANTQTDQFRQMTELAISYGKKRLSDQTGFLHHCYNLAAGEVALPIPLVENFLFALALLKSRQIDHVNQAKALLEKLLPFQNSQSGTVYEGNFPIYLHDYPLCKDRFTGILVAEVIFWILKDYAQGLGPLKGQLKEAFKNSLSHAVKTYFEKSTSYPVGLKIAAIAKESYPFLEDRKLCDVGRELFDKLSEAPDFDCWCSPSSLGTILSALSIAGVDPNNSVWNHFWRHLSATWHLKTAAYVGPSLKEFEAGFEPEVTLYDYYLGYYTGQLSKRALTENLAQLESALIAPAVYTFASHSYPVEIDGEIRGRSWRLYHEEDLAYCLVLDDQTKPKEAANHSFRLVYGDLSRCHSLVSAGGNASLKAFKTEGNQLRLTYELLGGFDLEDREKSRDLLFYVDVHPEMMFLVDGHLSSTFKLSESLVLRDDQCQITLRFDLEEGQGRFFGHRQLSNRPSQLNTKGIARYDVFDWQLFLRTVGRDEKCLIDVTLEIEPIKLAG
jgi:hypothetical protein